MSVGLDIGTKSIKIIELERSGGKFKLKAAGVVGHSAVNIDQMQQDDKTYVALVDAVKKLIKDTKVGSRDVTISLPESQVFSRVVTFPSLSDSEIASAVRWEAEQYIPIPSNEAIIQHQIIERNESETARGVKVLLVASSKSFVQKYVSLVNKSGLNVSSAETELIALARCLAPAEGTVMILDFGARSTDIAIAKNGLISFSRSIPTAGEAFTRAVSQALGVASQQAEEYKRTYGLSTRLESKVQMALEPVFRVITEEIKKAMHFYQTDDKGVAPTTLILAGGSAGIPDLVPSLSKELNIEVVIGNPFAKIEVDPETAKKLASFAPLYPIAVGLAMREG